MAIPSDLAPALYPLIIPALLWGIGVFCSFSALLVGVLARVGWMGFRGLTEAVKEVRDEVRIGFDKGDKRMDGHDIRLERIETTCKERHVERSGIDRRQS